MPLLISTTYITLPLLLLTSYQPYYHSLSSLHVNLYLTYFLYTLSPKHCSHIHNVHCIPPSHAFPSHVTSLHILPQLLPRLFIYFEKCIIYYINFVNNTYTHLRTM